MGLTLLGLSTAAKAQEVTYGLQVGSNYNMTSFGNKSVKDNNGKVGVSVAGFARIGNELFFQPGLGVSLLRKEYTFDKNEKTPKFYQINLPLQIGYKLINDGDFNLRAMLGPQLNYDIKTVKSTATTDYKKFSFDGRIGLGLATAMMGASNTFAKLTESFKAFSFAPHIWTQPSRYKSKPNKVSQAKRRKYVRQGRG